MFVDVRVFEPLFSLFFEGGTAEQVDDGVFINHTRLRADVLVAESTLRVLLVVLTFLCNPDAAGAKLEHGSWCPFGDRNTRTSGEALAKGEALLEFIELTNKYVALCL